jgi:hypothetical protein
MTNAAAPAPGSLIAVSHPTADFAPGLVEAAVAAGNTLMPTPVYRGEAEVTRLLRAMSRQHPGRRPGHPAAAPLPGGPRDPVSLDGSTPPYRLKSPFSQIHRESDGVQ